MASNANQAHLEEDGIVPENAPMAKKKAKSDRHPPSKAARIKLALARMLDHLAERNATSFQIEANRAVREMLEREEMWPERPNRPEGSAP